MNADELRSIQTPLKEQYRQTPGTAMITLRAQGHLGDGVSCRHQTGKGQVTAGLHPATGGSGMGGELSGDMLLEALVARRSDIECRRHARLASRCETPLYMLKAISTFAVHWEFPKKCRSAFRISACGLLWTL